MAPKSAWKGAGSNQFLEENKVVATFCWVGSINQSFLASWRDFLFCFFFKDILSRECWSLATVCVHCAELVKLFPSVISLFPNSDFPAAVGSWAFQPHPCCQVWLFLLDVHLLAGWRSDSHRKEDNCCNCVSFSLLKGLFIPFQQRHWEILAPTGTWLFTVTLPSFLSRTFLFFLWKQRPGDVWSPREHFWAQAVGRELWGCLRTDQKWSKKRNPHPWHRVRPTLPRSSHWSSCSWVSPRFNFWVFSALKLWKVNSGTFSDI